MGSMSDRELIAKSLQLACGRPAFGFMDAVRTVLYAQESWRFGGHYGVAQSSRALGGVMLSASNRLNQRPRSWVKQGCS